MRQITLICIAFFGLTVGVRAQSASSCKIPVNLERLAAKAAEVVDVNMDANMLQFAGNFLNKEK